MCARAARYAEFISRAPALAARTCAHRSRAHRAPLPARHNDQNLDATLQKAFVYKMKFNTMPRTVQLACIGAQAKLLRTSPVNAEWRRALVAAPRRDKSSAA